MDNERIYYLHERFLRGTLTAAEMLEWQHLVHDPQLEDQVLSLIEQSWKQIPQTRLVDMENGRSMEILGAIVNSPQVKKPVYHLWPRIGIAAAVATILFSTGLFFYKKQQKEVEQTYTSRNDIAPGQQGATLTLANGKKIRLTNAPNGELANEAGIRIAKTADGQLIYEIKGSGADPKQINTLSTAKGETYQVRLPDGSLVYLNAASSLTYAASLIEHGKRVVKLQGEGYFEITKDKKHPFVVYTHKQSVEVLGTHFNINAYADVHLIKTTLAEGSIKITAIGKSLVLKPNQEATLSADAIKIKEVDAELALAWKDGFFLFNRESLESVMTKIARWYDVEVVYNDPALKFETVTGTISRFEKISQVFNMLEKAEIAKFRIEGRKITIDKMK